ncbi:MAG: hypothetical protein WC942_04040 [Clostridia bacterium]|jgi:hypothetical protein
MTDKTSEILISMFTENTGVAMCDSGGTPMYDENGNYTGSQYGYGRNYERNLRRDFESEKECAVKFTTCDIEFYHNTYHWLKKRCEFSEELDTLFHNQFRDECDADENKSWPELMEEFPSWLANTEEYGEPSGIYGEGDPLCVNTYNEQNSLDQTLQFVYFTNNAGSFIILQVHGGADVRGGYTTPRVFATEQFSELDIFDYSRGNIHCTGTDRHPTAQEMLITFEEKQKQLKLSGMNYVDSTPPFDTEPSDHYWYTDDSYHWYFQGSCGFGAGTQLDKYEIKNLDDEDKWEMDKLCVKDGIGYCPICGCTLAGSS